MIKIRNQSVSFLKADRYQIYSKLPTYALINGILLLCQISVSVYTRCFCLFCVSGAGDKAKTASA